ncbi:hypothetical protein AOZ07_03795 [Glutamicibacter halophytocola]|uniref:hypothetical protein n=1 Tax=Glutamicibacter halophytocola TaxID=1933880 RepID=UPI0006D4AE8F|nr:hypothetical protein [Glutamicibacter halophytocola]ALG28206.1 hypothetical protein AOZ07_03795 [Glutamicibacter halophytocola]
MAHKGIVGTTTLMALGWTVFVLGLAALFFDPLVGALLAIAGAVQISGGMITEALNRKRNAFEVLQNSREEEMPAID